MTLTLVERVILANQMHILEILDRVKSSS